MRKYSNELFFIFFQNHRIQPKNSDFKVKIFCLFLLLSGEQRHLFRKVMRKLLFLASFKARTGELQFDETRLMAIEVKDEETFSDVSDRAYNDQFFPWFEKNYPESECVSFKLHETI